MQSRPKRKIVFKKFPTLQKKNKTPDTQARQKSTRQMTETDDIKMVVTHDRQGTPAYNSRFAKAGVSCFYESEVQNSSFVHLIKFSAKNPRLRKAAKRYHQCYDDTKRTRK